MKRTMLWAGMLCALPVVIHAQHAKKGTQAAPPVPPPALTPANAPEGEWTREGFFDVHQEGGRYFFHIPDTLLGRDILVVSRLVKANAGGGYYADDELDGTMGGEGKVVRFEKVGDKKIGMDTVSYSIRNDAASPLYAAVANSNMPLVVATFDIMSRVDNDAGSIIDVTDLLKGGTGLVSSSASSIAGVAVHDNIIEIIAPRNAYHGTAEISTALILLSKIPMQGRLEDARVGYFTTADKTAFEEKQVRTLRFIARWRLEPKPGDLDRYMRGETVEPQNPIVVYIDPNTPAKWVPYLIQGVNDWAPALERAGFKNAIMARRAPSREEDSTWNLATCRAAIVYKASTTANALGAHIHDPRSGEIIQSHINWYHNIMQMMHDYYMIQAGPSDTAARHMVFNDSLTGQLIREISSHEVGHLLGLKHNLGASSSVPVAYLRNKQWVEANGHTPSIMDYSRFNYVAQPEDSIGLAGMLPRIGEYDKWAIEWGYRLFPYNSPEAERAHLDAWTREQLKDRRRWWGDGESVRQADPRSQAEDLGDDGILANTYGIRNLQRVLVPHLVAWTREPYEDFEALGNLYHGIIGANPQGAPNGQFSNYILHVTRIIGGTYVTARVAEDTAAVFVPVPAARQRAAVAFLQQQLFTTPRWLFPQDIMDRTGDNPLRLLGGLQSATLIYLFNTSLGNLQRQESMGNGNVYTADALLTDLEAGIWSELSTHHAPDIYRRRLQKNYVSMLADYAGQQSAYEASTAARLHMNRLQQRIRTALPGYTDAMSIAHLQEMLDKLDTSSIKRK